MPIRIIKFKITIFFIFLCINSFTFCMNQTKDTSQSNFDDFFTSRIIPYDYSNEATLNYTGLRLVRITPKNYFGDSAITPPTFLFKSTTKVPYIILPHNIDEHEQDIDKNWHIKTTIKKYSKTFKSDNNRNFVYVAHNPLSEWITTSKKNRHTTNKVFLDKYTQANILAKGPILAQCTTILSTSQYIHLLRTILTESLLISKLTCDFLITNQKKINFPSKVISDVFFTNTIIAESTCNKLCNYYDHNSSLRIGCFEDQSKLKVRYTNKFNFSCIIEDTDGICYKINPQNIDEHQQNSDGDWVIKTTITNYENKPLLNDNTFCIGSIDLLSEWLTNIKTTRQKPLIEIDKYTQTTVYPSENIIAECTTTLAPNKYILFLRKIVKKNLLISQDNF